MTVLDPVLVMWSVPFDELDLDIVLDLGWSLYSYLSLDLDLYLSLSLPSLDRELLRE